MRLAMSMLADAVNVREGMLNVLSAGVSTIHRPEYPAPLGVDLALAIELEASDLAAPGNAQLQVVLIGSENEEIGMLEGEFHWEITDALNGYIPVPVNFRDSTIPAPGDYRVRVQVGDMPEVNIPLRAALVAA